MDQGDVAYRRKGKYWDREKPEVKDFGNFQLRYYRRAGVLQFVLMYNTPHGPLPSRVVALGAEVVQTKPEIIKAIMESLKELFEWKPRENEEELEGSV